nr:FAD-binding and (Fe-S)-binding domain-containing protein [Pseudonocardia hierapolitana]
MDASNYRHDPLAVVLPRDAEDVAAAVAVAREFGVPVTARGGGTSVAGNAIGPGVVLDFSRHLTGIVEVDPERGTATVEPGVVLDDLRAAAGAHGLTFGPDPSTHSRCTVGGMLGNDACGSHSVRWGRTSHNVEALDVLLYDGTRMRVGPDGPALGGAARERAVYRELHALARENLATLRTGFPPVERRVSGYALDALLPENGFDVARSLVGTEGTCVTVLSATVRLVPVPAAKALLVLGFPDDVAAAEAVPAVLPLRPQTVEGMDARLLRLATGSGAAAAAHLPDGGAWLFVEVAGESAGEAAENAAAIAASVGTRGAVVTDPGLQRLLWRAREEGAGVATRAADGREAWPGWEDAAVPPDRLASYLREFRALLAAHGLTGITFGHFGEGCIHTRIDVDLVGPGGAAGFRRFVTDAADLVVAHGGSLSGEHGDGQARSELLGRMYPPEMIALFERFKSIWDPDDGMNPGVIVRPRPLDEDLRFVPPVGPLPVRFGYPHDGGDFRQAVRRCVGVGKCREAHPSSDSDVMCPSFRATREEKDSTRGRARVLLEMVNGDVVEEGWRSPEVRDALDLCLSCKGCRSDCPVGVDMATYKSEFLHQHYRGRVRPAAHYSMGHLPTLARLAALAPGPVNSVARSGLLGPLVRRLGGIAEERRLPAFAPTTFARWFRSRQADAGSRPEVLLWPDTFTNHFSPQVGRAATEVLEAAGFAVRLPAGRVCCGLTWLSTGQLDTASRIARRTQRILAPVVEAGLPVVVLEPSCAAALRVDLPELLSDEASRHLADRVLTLAEFLDTEAGHWDPPQHGGQAVRQVHCHQHAVLGSDADERVLARLAVDTVTLASGCCGLAGNFGFERGHYEVSMAIGEHVLLPAVRAASPDTLVLADGFSCRTQIIQGAGRQALHLAEVAAGRLYSFC